MAPSLKKWDQERLAVARAFGLQLSLSGMVQKHLGADGKTYLNGEKNKATKKFEAKTNTISYKLLPMKAMIDSLESVDVRCKRNRMETIIHVRWFFDREKIDNNRKNA